MEKPRQLKASEMDVRVASVKKDGTGASLLIYKDARVDMVILDEWVGSMNWKREHTRNNANCIVSIWAEDKNQWISKEDTGAESFTEKEKGLASDSFKRACFNWGIGRELYTAPSIWVNLSDHEVYKNSKGGFAVKIKFKVSEVEYNENREIINITITDERGNIKYSTNKKTKAPEKKKEPEQPKKIKFQEKHIEQVNNKLEESCKENNKEKAKGIIQWFAGLDGVPEGLLKEFKLSYELNFNEKI